MTGASDFTKMVPGFDFLQSLMKGAGAGLPQINQWIAPTLDPEELEKRIQDLKTVQFWLEQNTRLLGTTIQALEVQRMTLNTLKTMNLPLADLGAALRVPSAVAAPAPAPMAEPAAEPEPAPASATAASKGGVDPMQWWGALTQQFSEIAAQAMKDSTADAARQLAGNLVQQSISAAQQTLKTAVAAGTTPAVKSTAKSKAGAGTSTAKPRTKPAAKRPRAAPAAPRRSRG